MSAQTGPDPLDALADHFGIVSDYYDIFGRQHVTSADTKRAILAAMGIKAHTAEDVARELAACRDEPWRQSCDPVLVKRAGDAAATWSFRMPVHHQEDRHVQIRWSIQDEQEQFRLTGEAGPNLIPVDTHEIGDQRYVRFDLPLPAISDIGYYTLTAVGSTASTCVEGTLRIILAPARCYEPAGLWHGVRLWGLSLHLYALRSSTNWGVGDFGDLAEWLEWAAKDLGAGMVGLNPVHALKNSRPYHIGPYSPDSRLYVNTLYLDMQKIPDLSECAEAQQMVADESFRSRVEALRERETVEYEGVYEAKLKILEALFASFQQRHCRVNGPSLQPRT